MPVYLIAGEEMDIRVDVEDDCSLRLYINGEERGHYVDGKAAAEALGMLRLDRDRMDLKLVDAWMLAVDLNYWIAESNIEVPQLLRDRLMKLITGRETPCSKPSEPS